MIAVSSYYEEHKQVAKNLKELINWMKPGSSAPGFQLKDLFGGTHNLDEYEGKYVYISFISLSSPSSLAEMNLLADVFEDYGQKLHFVSIIIDNPEPDWQGIIRKYRMNWDLLTAEGEQDLIEQYGARAIPLFVLVDPQGNIFRYPAPSPSENLRDLLGSLN
jgi:peroxiredoxin